MSAGLDERRDDHTRPTIAFIALAVAAAAVMTAGMTSDRETPLAADRPARVLPAAPGPAPAPADPAREPTAFPEFSMAHVVTLAADEITARPRGLAPRGPGADVATTPGNAAKPAAKSTAAESTAAKSTDRTRRPGGTSAESKRGSGRRAGPGSTEPRPGETGGSQDAAPGRSSTGQGKALGQRRTGPVRARTAATTETTATTATTETTLGSSKPRGPGKSRGKGKAHGRR